MKKTLIIIGVILSLGAVLTFSYFSSGTGTQGFIKKKGRGGEESIYKRDIDVGVSRDVISRTNLPDCTSSWSPVSQKLDVIVAALNKIEASYPKVFIAGKFDAITGEYEVDDLPELITKDYANGMTEMLNATSNFDNAFTNYQVNGCQNQKSECSKAVKTLNDKLAERWEVHNIGYKMLQEDKEYREKYKAEYLEPYAKLQTEYNNTLKVSEKNKINEKMKALNKDPNIIAINEKIKEIQKVKADFWKQKDGFTGNTGVEKATNDAIANFKAQCGK